MRTTTLCLIALWSMWTGCQRKPPPSAPPEKPQVAAEADDDMDASYLADLAQVHANHQRHERALALLERAVAKETDEARRARLQMRVGEIYDQLGRKEDATRAYEEAGDKLEDPGQRALLMLRLGQSYRRAEKLPEAAEALEKALESGAQPYVRDSARSEILQVWKAQGVLQDKLAEYEERLKKQPDDPDALRTLGAAYSTVLGKPELAIPHYQRLAAAEPGQFGLAWQLGNLYFQARQFEQGVAYFKKLAQEMPNRRSEMYERVASGYASLGKKQDALLWAEKMLQEAAQKTPHLYIQQAHLFGRIGEEQRAVQSFGKAIETATGEPQRQQFRYDLASFHVSRKRLQEGRDLLEQLQAETVSGPLKQQIATLLDNVERQIEQGKAASAPAPQPPQPAPGR